MGITISDIERAISGGGDVSTFTAAWHRALGNPPVPSAASLEIPSALPATTVLLKRADKGLEPLVAAWVKGKGSRSLTETEIDLTLMCLPHYGQNAGSYLAHIIDEVSPDIIAIDTSPLELSAAMLYAFSLPCAVGLAADGEILTREGGQFYASETFHPGNINETAIITSWLNKIPLLPVGIPLKPGYSKPGSRPEYAGETDINQGMSQSNLVTAYRALDESLGNATSLREGIEVARDICVSLMKTIDSKTRETLVEEACYIASRIWEIAAYIKTRKRKARLLAIVDMKHYPDVEYISGFLKQGITEEIYVPPKSYAVATDLVMIGRDSSEMNEPDRKYVPESTLTQELFLREFDSLIKAKDNEILSVPRVDKLIPEIVGRTRSHPDITRGASVRGTLALKEILQSLSGMRDGLTRDNIGKAALITLPPRISAGQGNDKTAIISDIVKEVLYDIRFSATESQTISPIVLDWLSDEDIMEGLKNLKPLSREQNQALTQTKMPAITVEPGKNREMLKYLESKELLQKKQQNQYSLTQKALESLMNELDQKLKVGEITQGEYQREKDRLMEMLKSSSQPLSRMSANELADTIMEMMDAQDKQWGSKMSFERMHIYYHMGANSKDHELSPQKQDYYGLKTLIGDLEKLGILGATETATDFTLTGKALGILLEHLITRDPKGRGLQGSLDFGKTLVDERKHEIRRYSSGDTFRDISVRHTLKEIARQKKKLSDIRKSDFRVFIKQHRKLQSDIVLCLDTSGSMGSHHKLMYARLAAAGLAKAAIENGDRVGMVTFDNSGQTPILLTNKDKDVIINYVVKLSARGNTNIGDGIKCASELLFQNRSHNQKYILLITDGQPTAISQGVFDQLKTIKEKDLSEESAILETRKASDRGVKVSVIHIAARDEASGEFIRNITRAGKGKIHRMSSPADLETIIG